MTQETTNPISSTAPSDVTVEVTVQADGTIRVNPDCVSMDPSKRLVWRCRLPMGRTLARTADPVRFTFHEKPEFGPFNSIRRLGESDDWVSEGNNGKTDLYHYDIVVELASEAGSVVAVADPVIYNHGTPPQSGSEAGKDGSAEAKAGS